MAHRLHGALVAVLLLMTASAARAVVSCAYSGSGCNAGYAATASFECISASQLRITMTNTSTVNAMSEADNILSTITFGGATPLDSVSDSAIVPAGSALLPAGQTDCAGNVDGPDVTCEWGAGPNYCTNATSLCRGSDNACLAALPQCGLAFVGSRETTDVNCTGGFRLDAANDIDGSADGPDFGLINAPAQPQGGNEAVDDTVVATLNVGVCVESAAFCTGCAVFGSHFRHACSGPLPTTTTSSTSSTSFTTSTSPTTSTSCTTTSSTVPSTSSTSSTQTSSTTSTSESSTSSTSSTTSTTSTSETSTSAPSSSTSSTSATSTSSTTSSSESSTTSTSATSTTAPTALIPCLTRDHFKCYHTTQVGFPRFDRRDVETSDQFGDATTRVIRPMRLCNPVDKNGEGVDDPASHLMCYQADDPGNFQRRNVIVTNQFGEQSLAVIRPESLCLPAEKDGVPRPPESPLDHFKCYRVHRRHGTPDFQPRVVTLADQFETKSVTVLKPLLLCNPVDKAGEGVNDPTCHLTCYKIEQSNFEPRLATVVDQFTEATVNALTGACRKVGVLCVPSLKRLAD